MLITTTTGSENFQSGSTKNYVFVVPSRRNSFPANEMHIFVAAKSGQPTVKQIGMPNTVPAAPNAISEIGKWTTSTYDVQEGTILKLFAARSGSFGSMRASATMLLRVRQGAALLRIGTILSGNPKATYSRAWTEGRFDIIPPDQAHLLGVQILPHFLAAYSDSACSRIFEKIIVDREISSAAVNTVEIVENSQGEKVEVHNVRKARALDL